jgi:hypothetical protein
MIFTFKIINGCEKKIFWAENKEDAFIELKVMLGTNADNYSLISYVEDERFYLTTY